VRIALLAVAACAAATATSAYGAARPVDAHDRALVARPATAEERIAEGVARRLTRHSVSVRCGDLRYGDPRAIGVTLILEGRSLDYFLMRPEVCAHLAWFRDDPVRWDPRTCAGGDCSYVPGIVWALETVAHESYHILGYRNEAQVDCYGMQSIWFVANRLGASVAESQALASYFATRLYPLRRAQTPRYWSAQCRDGGAYDLRRSLARWPS